MTGCFLGMTIAFMSFLFYVNTLLPKRFPQIIHIRIGAVYQVDFPLPVPFFELLFAANGFADAVVPFVVHQVGEVVFFGKFTALSIAVVVYASAYVGSDTDVEYSAIFIRYDIHPTAFRTYVCVVHFVGFEFLIK